MADTACTGGLGDSSMILKALLMSGLFRLQVHSGPFYECSNAQLGLATGMSLGASSAGRVCLRLDYSGGAWDKAIDAGLVHKPAFAARDPTLRNALHMVCSSQRHCRQAIHGAALDLQHM